MQTLPPIICSLLFFSAVNCFAEPSSSELSQLKNQENFNVNVGNVQKLKVKLTSVIQIPEVTYRYLEGVFSSFYNKVTFNTAITDSTFKPTLESDVVAIPLIATNRRGLQLEVFGNFCNFSKQYLSNLSTDHAMYEYMTNSAQTDYLNSELSFGAGVSFKTSQSSKVKLLISNNDMPGYGRSRTLLGFETSF